MLNQRVLFVALGILTVASAQPSRAQPAGPMSAHDFAQAAAESDQYEIEAAEVAAINSQDTSVKAFARQMIQDHSQTRQSVQQAATASGMAPPPMALSDSGQKMLAELQGLQGPEFDKAYVRQQVLAHHQALVVEQGYAANGSDPSLRQAAQSAVPMIQQHLDTAQRMQRSTSGS